MLQHRQLFGWVGALSSLHGVAEGEKTPFEVPVLSQKTSFRTIAS